MYILVDYANKYSIFFSAPKTWVMWAIIDLHDYLMFFLINIFVIVLFFLLYWISEQRKFDVHWAFKLEQLSWRKYLRLYSFRKLEDVNHAPLLEFFWTLTPTFLLLMMGWPSFRVLYAMEQLIDPFHTVIIVGNQWYWTYQYSDFDIASDLLIQLDSKKKLSLFEKKISAQLNLSLILIEELRNHINRKDFLQLAGRHLRTFEESKIIYDSVIISDESLPKGYPRLLSTDQVLILPSNISIRLLVTSSDVIHSWALPSHGLKMDAIPGRINQIPFICSFWGTYWGQCSELCGINHGFMPIEVRVVPFVDYLDYIKLNISFRYDKFIPLLENFFFAYLKHLKYRVEKDKFCYSFNLILNSIKSNNYN